MRSFAWRLSLVHLLEGVTPASSATAHWKEHRKYLVVHQTDLEGPVRIGHCASYVDGLSCVCAGDVTASYDTVLSRSAYPYTEQL